ncbi:MAG: hypothetical protein JO235_04190 [Chroococcidiopsidaceae cyanobacterium CP_BM_RX_35]|nr:hypothetical protein [Chroococcidiopsidaceae cyanobacterium CP_BM_RX_35]
MAVVLAVVFLPQLCSFEILYACTDELLSGVLSRMAARGLHQLPVVDRDRRERILGLLEREQIDLVCRVAATRQLLRHYLSVPSKPDELSLPTLKPV